MKFIFIAIVLFTVVSAQQQQQQQTVVDISYSSVSAKSTTEITEFITTSFKQLRTAIVSEQIIQVTTISEKVGVYLRALKVKVPTKKRSTIDTLTKDVNKIPPQVKGGHKSKALKIMKKIDKLWKKFRTGSKKSGDSSESNESNESGESGESDERKIKI